MNGADTDRADHPPEFLPDPMLRPITTELRKTGGVMCEGVACILEQQSVNSQELRHQSRELATIKKSSKANGASIDTLERLQLATVVDQHKTIFAAYTLWARWRGPLKWVGGSIASLVVVGLGAFIKHLVESL